MGYYWWQRLDGVTLLMDGTNNGLIVQDGHNPEHMKYLAWAEDHETPTVVEGDAPLVVSATAKLVKLGLTPEEAAALIGVPTDQP